MLAKYERFTAYNNTGQALASAADITIKRIGWNLDSSNALAYETSEATVLSNASSFAASSYLSSSAIDNSTVKYMGGHYAVKVIAPASSSGVVSIYRETSGDGTTWPTNGRGTLVHTVLVPTNGTYNEAFEL